MIHLVNGDILLSRSRAIADGVGPGDLWACAGADGVRIVNLLTQDAAPGHHAHPGRASTAHVNQALRKLRHFALTEKIASLAMPRLATAR